MVRVRARAIFLCVYYAAALPNSRLRVTRWRADAALAKAGASR